MPYRLPSFLSTTPRNKSAQQITINKKLSTHRVLSFFILLNEPRTTEPQKPLKDWVKTLLGRTILSLVLILKHTEVRLIARRRQPPLFQRREHSASRLVRVSAIAIFTILR